MSQANPRGIKLYEKELEVLMSLDEKMRGNILNAIVCQFMGGEIPKLDPAENAIFVLVYEQVKRAEELSEKRRNNVNLRYKGKEDIAEDTNTLQNCTNELQGGLTKSYWCLPKRQKCKLANVRYPLVKISYTSGAYYDEAEIVCGVLQQAKLMPPTEQAFELTQKWGTGTTPIKADAVPTPKPKMVEVSSEPWRCTKCDYQNPPASSVCLNCFAPKHKLPEGKTHLSEAAQEASAREVWYCPECDYKNTGGKSCRNCGESRPIPKSKNTKNLFGNLLKK